MIRQAHTGDLFQIEYLIESGVKEGTLLRRGVKELEKKIGNFYVYDNKGIQGCVSLDCYTNRIAELRSLYIVPKYRGQKIASKLIEKCLEVAREKGIKEVITISAKESLFRRCGFSDQIGSQKALFTRLT